VRRALGSYFTCFTGTKVLAVVVLKGQWIKEGAVVIDVGEEGSGLLLYLLYWY
jgi:hypothetical protein